MGILNLRAMRLLRRISTPSFTGLGAIALVGAGETIVHAQTAGAGGTANYWMIAETTSGMPSMSAGGRPGMSMGAIMGMARGRQSSFSHTLQLRLGSPRRAPAEPSAEHLPPAGLQAGASLPLVTPRNAPVAAAGPWRMEKPKGRMLLYWGCGDRARAGQPVVIDYASLAAGTMPPAFATFRSLVGPTPATSTTYGEWPNGRFDMRVPAEGSLVGDHVVRGNYTPEIRFTLAPGQDFLTPVVMSGNEAGRSGAVPLAWQPVNGARAWFVSTMGSARNGDVILWSSSESQAFPMAMSQIAPDEVARLVQSRVLLPSAATACTVPAEVAKAAEGSVVITTAFGGEYNFSHPVRPAKAPPSWRPEWTVKLLTKSTFTGILGMDTSRMMGAPGDQPADQPRRKRGFGLGDLFGN
jgi:hypothetical protein